MTATSTATTEVLVPAATETANKEAAATTVKPAEDLSEPTGAVSSEGFVDPEEGWGFFSYLFFLLVIAGAGFAIWKFEAVKYVKLLVSGRERAHYRKVEADVER
ncbi:hypothetical protein C2E23DRAFT_880203 [Lenzites betulinus]|nr:hypothetical protein C2E23DRAFT_880203 [Lenzites betulinus]